MKVEVIYFAGCPNHPPAANRVREVLEQERTPAEIIEIEVKDSFMAQQVGFLGSPTIRVDGKDIELSAWAVREFGLTCRTYINGGQPLGVPPPEWIRAAVREARGRELLDPI